MSISAERWTKLKPAEQAHYRACDVAREREYVELLDTRVAATAAIERAAHCIADAQPYHPLDKNRLLLDVADRQLTAVREHLRELRRCAKAIHARREREQNGVYRP